MSRVGVIGDLHLPATHPEYLRFCRDVFLAWGVRRIVQIGDLVDNHNISFHPREVDAIGLKEERRLTLKMLSKWTRQFPKVDVVLGNHDLRRARKAATVNLGDDDLKTYAEAFNTPTWRYHDSLVIDDVLYIHGTEFSGKTPALNAAVSCGQSVVMGHIHSVAGVRWAAGPKSRVFGMDVGCGVDINNPAMRYGRGLVNQPILACAVVIDGYPKHEVMPCGPGEKYGR